jgi:WD40 repeat protein
MYLIGTRSNRVTIWDEQSKQHLATLKSSHNLYPYTYSCSGDGRLLAICGFNFGQIILWDISAIDSCRELNPLTLTFGGGIVRSICFTENCEQLVVGTGDLIMSFEVATGLLLHITKAAGVHVEMVRSIGERIVTLSSVGILQEWNSALKETRQEPLGVNVRSASLASTKDIIAAASLERSIITIELTTMTKKEVFRGVAQFNYLQFRRDGSHVIASMHQDSR